MPRGRPRTRPANLPAHIDHHRIPAGVYWGTSGRGRWYVIDDNPDTGRRKVTVAGPEARLSELHAILEGRQGNSARGTIDWLSELFVASGQFKKLAAATRKDYKWCAAVVKAWPTRLGVNFGTMPIQRLTVAVIQRLVDQIADGQPESRPGADDGRDPAPAKANHVLRYLRRLFAWGIQRGHCTTNPARGVLQATERRHHGMPALPVFAAVLAFARARGAITRRTKGSLPPYLAPMMEIAYACRLRGIEVISLTDADHLPEGIQCRRRKGSLDNTTQWTPRLRAAWKEAAAIRTEAIARKCREVQLRPEDRVLFVAEDGAPLRKGAFDDAWRDLMRTAIESKVITEAERFSLHSLKHRGITDTEGTKAEKKDAAGHVTDGAFRVYDHDLPLVRAASKLAEPGTST